MKILAVMGSPRKSGNTDLLLDKFLKGVSDAGGEFEKICVQDLDISPCLEDLSCEKSGQCIVKDDMQNIYEKLLESERLVIASPIFFYGLPAQLKALIDRGHALWARKHLLNVKPEKTDKESFALLLGATKGEKLFDGVLLTLKYFLEPLDARLVGKLLYRKIEKAGDIQKHPTAFQEAYQAGRSFI